MTNRYGIVSAGLWVVLALALAGSLRHVAHTFASVDGAQTWGWIQALAIDSGLFALAFGISERRRIGRASGGLWVGVVMFSLISIYGNLAYALGFGPDGLPGWVVTVRPYLLSASLPVLVIYLAEVVGSDVNHAARLADRERQRQERRERATASDLAKANDTLDDANNVRVDDKRRAVEALVAYVADNPDTSLAQAGRAIGRSKTTVSEYLTELEADGRISRNGSGVRVLEGVR